MTLHIKFNCESSAVTACAEIESMARPTEYQRFVDQARCLGTEINLSDPIDDGAICPGCVVLRMEYGNYVVNGVGPTSNIACANAIAKTNGLLRQQLGFVQPCKDAVPVNKENTDDFLRDAEVVLNSDRFSQKHQSYLKLARHFILEDYGRTDSSMTRLQKITAILGSLVSYENVSRNNTYIVKCTYSKYYSTGMGLNIKEAKSHAAVEMLHTLKQICGFVLIEDDVNSVCAGPAVGSMYLRLPESNRFKLKVLKHFLITPHQNVSSEAHLREIAALTDETLQVTTFSVQRSKTLLQVQYRVSYCRASATNVDESICKNLCCVKMILALHKWCGFNLTNKYEDVEKYYKNLNGKDVGEERYSMETGQDIGIGEILVDDVQVFGNENISKVTEMEQKIVEDFVEISDQVKCTGNENTDVSEMGHEKSLAMAIDNTVKDKIREDNAQLTEDNNMIVSAKIEERKHVSRHKEATVGQFATDEVTNKNIRSDETVSTPQDATTCENQLTVDNPTENDCVQDANEQPATPKANKYFEAMTLKCTRMESQSVYCHTKYITLRQGDLMPEHVRNVIRQTVPASKKAVEPLKFKMHPVAPWRRTRTFGQDYMTQNDNHYEQGMSTFSIRTRIDKLVRNATGILNKITPDSFLYFTTELLAVFVKSLSTQNLCFEIILDLLIKKAVDEPIYTNLYARLCQAMYMLAIKDGHGMFSTMLDTRLMEKLYHGLYIDFMEYGKLTTYKTEIDTCPDHNTCYEFTLELQEMEMGYRTHAIGLCRFIGNLHLTQYYSAEVMFNYLEGFYAICNDASLECLCTMLSIIEPSLNKMTNLMALDAYKCMVRNLRLLVTLQDPLVLLSSNKTKIKITNFFTAWDLKTSLKCPDGPKCINETNKDVVDLFREERLLPLNCYSRQMEPKNPVVTKRSPGMSTLTGQPLDVAVRHNIVPSDNNVVDRDSNGETELSRLVDSQKDCITKPRVDNLPRILKRQTPRKDEQIQDPVDGTAAGLKIRENDRSGRPDRAHDSTAATTTTTRGRPQNSVAGPQRDDNTRETRDRQTRTERLRERQDGQDTAAEPRIRANERQCSGRNDAAEYFRHVFEMILSAEDKIRLKEAIARAPRPCPVRSSFTRIDYLEMSAAWDEPIFAKYRQREMYRKVYPMTVLNTSHYQLKRVRFGRDPSLKSDR